MRWFLILIWVVPALCFPAAAMELEAPAVPDSAGDWMPGDTGSFADGKLNGQGTYTWVGEEGSEGRVYTGYFKDGLITLEP